MQIYPFLISHCKNNRPLFTDRFPLYTNTDREIVTGGEREREKECELKGGQVAQLYIQKTKKKGEKTQRVSKECQEREEGRMTAEVKSVLGITIMCLSVSL